MGRYRFDKDESEQLHYKGSDGGDKSVKLEPGGFYHLPDDNGIVKHLVVTKVLVVPEASQNESEEQEAEVSEGPKFEHGNAVVCANHAFKMTVEEVDGDDVLCKYNDNENQPQTGVYKADELSVWVAPEDRVPGADEVE